MQTFNHNVDSHIHIHIALDIVHMYNVYIFTNETREHASQTIRD